MNALLRSMHLRRVGRRVTAASAVLALAVTLVTVAPAAARIDPPITAAASTTGPPTTTPGTSTTSTTTPPPSPQAAPNDALFHQQWGLAAINAPAAWPTATGKGIVIGVVDTGADLVHEDLAVKVAGSTNCVGTGGDPTQCKASGQDDNGHGTHVTGIAAAATGNGKGIAGAAPDAKFVVAKVLDGNGAGNVGDIGAGIHWVVDHGARVVNLSLGNPDLVLSSLLGNTFQDAIEYAWSKGAVPVLAAGNANVLGFGSNNYGNVDAIVVGATGRDGAVAGYSSPTGTAKWALLAPGGSQDGAAADDIVSTYWVAGQPNAYKALAGTDQAAAFVSGTVALLLSEGLTPATAVSRLLTTVNTSVACGTGSNNCHGLLNAAAAVVGTSQSPTTAPNHVATSVPPTSAPAQLPTTGPPTVAPPAVMSPSRRTPPSPAPAPAARATSGNTTLQDSHAVALAPPVRSRESSIAWFVALAALFLLGAGAGAFWLFRMHPDPD